jgi:hypothetical protein
MERASISTGPVPVLERPEEEAPLVTELILGERLVVLDERGCWLRVLVLVEFLRQANRGLLSLGTASS